MFLLFTCGCSPRVTQIGPSRYSITRCRNVDACYAEANRVCGFGRFDLLDHSRSTNLVQGLNYDNGNMHMHSPSTVVQKDEMLIECQATSGRDAAGHPGGG